MFLFYFCPVSGKKCSSCYHKILIKLKKNIQKKKRYSFAAKFFGSADFQVVDYYVIIGLHLISSCGGLGNGRVKNLNL